MSCKQCLAGISIDMLNALWRGSAPQYGPVLLQDRAVTLCMPKHQAVVTTVRADVERSDTRTDEYVHRISSCLPPQMRQCLFTSLRRTVSLEQTRFLEEAPWICHFGTTALACPSSSYK